MSVREGKNDAAVRPEPELSSRNRRLALVLVGFVAALALGSVLFVVASH